MHRLFHSFAFNLNCKYEFHFYDNEIVMYITATHKVKVVLCKPIANVNTPCQAAFNNISSSFHAIKNLEIYVSTTA
jgi:hypothetical protein